MIMKKYIHLVFIIGALSFFGCRSIAQPTETNQYDLTQFTEADTLRGMLLPERSCYDVYFYDLNVEIHPATKSVSGEVAIHFQATQDFTQLQLDLFQNMKIDQIIFKEKPVLYHRKHNAVFVQLPPVNKNEKGILTVQYHGQPIRANNAPWDGGFVWAKDQMGQDWIAVACEGTGASLWWPNKDHLSDEPDSMMIRATVPNPLKCIANGNLINTTPRSENRTQFDWKITYPINNYNVTLNIGDYVSFSEKYYAADSSVMDLDYYVISYNEDKAREHFKQVPSVLSCFEQYFGKYPFWEDGYALVETPYLGMEHQGAIAYGNRYMRGYLGGMIPADMDWDYIIVHETGHEYFGNSVSCNDHAEMWIHESFTTYMEALYVECMYGYEDALRYLDVFRGSRYILNRKPIVGPLNVNFDKFGSSDHYFKGSWVLHTIRSVINDDEKWFRLLRDYYEQFKINHVDTPTTIAWFEEQTPDQELEQIFNQYLFYADIPVLEYSLMENGNNLEVRHRWKANVPGFKMPVMMGNPDDYTLVEVETDWTISILEGMTADNFKIATDRFLIDLEQIE